MTPEGRPARFLGVAILSSTDVVYGHYETCRLRGRSLKQWFAPGAERSAIFPVTSSGIEQ